MYHNMFWFDCSLLQRRQSGLKSGVMDPGKKISIFSGNSKKFWFFQANFLKILFFQAIFKKNWFSRQKFAIYSYF